MQRVLNHPQSLFGIYKSLFEHNPDASYALDTQGRFVLVNDQTVKLTGYTKKEILHLSFSDIVKENYLESMFKIFSEVLDGKMKSFEVSITNKSGKMIDLYITSMPIFIENQVVGIVGMTRDMTEKNVIKRELEKSRNQLQNLFNSIDVCLWSADFDQTLVYQISPACQKIFGYSQEKFIKSPNLWKEAIHPHDIAYVEKKKKELLEGKNLNLEYRIIDVNGEIKWITNEVIPIFDDFGHIIRLDGIVADISQRHIAEEKLQFMAYHDMLTNLPNRRLFKKILRKSVLKTKETNTKVAILFLGLNRFTLINDYVGYNRGDKLLKIIAKRLQGALRKEDIISRHGGDEFTILLKNITDIKQVEHVAKKLIDTVTSPIRFGERNYILTTSIGISLYPDHANNSDNLIKHADQAMYVAKMNGKNTYQFYQTGISHNMSRD